MQSVVELTSFFGWCTVINMAILAFTVLVVTVFNAILIRVHSKLFNIDASELPKLYFKYLANYKIGLLILNVVPYTALKLMA